MRKLITDMPEVKKKKHVGPVIFRIILIVIAGLTVGIGVFTWNASGLVGNQLPMPFGFGMSVIMSPSMEPVLNTNDLVFVTEADSYQNDDIVVYQDGNMLIIHRIISIDGDTVITKGDANNVADDPIAIDDIKAKLLFRIPFVGFIVKYIKTIPGTLLILFIAVFLLYKSRRKERDADREEMEDIVKEINRLRQNMTVNEATPAASGEVAIEKDSDTPSQTVMEETAAESTAVSDNTRSDDATESENDDSAVAVGDEPKDNQLDSAVR